MASATPQKVWGCYILYSVKMTLINTFSLLYSLRLQAGGALAPSPSPRSNTGTVTVEAKSLA